MLVYLEMPSVLQPEVIIGKAQERFAPDGTLNDDKVAKLIKQLLAGLVDLTRRTQAGF
jgi:hypothetical protein